jgi:hypothetical protein
MSFKKYPFLGEEVIAEGCTVNDLSGNNGSTDRSHFIEFHFCNNFQFNVKCIDDPGPHSSPVGG